LTRRGNRILAQELTLLGLDLQTTLDDEPRFLLDPGFLGALHSELLEQLGPRDTRAALLQLGYLHGLRDAWQVVMAGMGASPAATAPHPTAPRLAIKVEPRRGLSLEVAGSWPERLEAEAVATALGGVSGPSCHLSAGYTSGWLSGVFDSEVLVVETACCAAGAASCRFEVREPRAWLASAHGPALDSLEAMPFQELREIVAQHLDRNPPIADPDHEGFEAGSGVVHVWGPVMVVPFSGPDESLRAVELIGRDPGAHQVRVVVVDLSGAIIDEGFGAASLERILDAIESWGAEPMLSGVSPLSERVVADLERSHLVIHKDLPEAIAAGFQIAEAQRLAS